MAGDKLGAEPIRFSTDNIPEHSRIAVWREVLGRVHLRLDVEPIGEKPLRAAVESHRGASTSLYFSDSTPVRAARTRALVQDADCAFRLLYTDGGSYRFTAQGSDEVIPAGSAALLFNGTPSEVLYPRRCRVTAIRVERAALKAAVPALEERAMQRLPAAFASPALRLLMQYVNVLRSEGPTSEETLAQQISAHLTDLIALALGATGDVAEIAADRGVPAARLAAIKSDVLAKLVSRDLSVAMMAAQHGVTPRYVHKLFEREGTTFSAFVLQLRLARAQQMLQYPRFANHTISAIAFECGFGDLSHFNRAFRRAYGATPSDVREAAFRAHIPAD